jgi:type VI secretion system protein ImpF
MHRSIPLPPKGRYLPSLLDRLTDDNPVQALIRPLEEKIFPINNALAELPRENSPNETEESRKQRHQLKCELDKLLPQYGVLKNSLFSLEDIKACVIRDLELLLNTSQYYPQVDLDGYPLVASSVLNYGMPDLTGRVVSNLDPVQLERLFRQVIINFEPRIIPRTLNVKVIADKNTYSNNALSFEIEGNVWAEPEPLYLRLRTDIELDNGNVTVNDFLSAVQRP